MLDQSYHYPPELLQLLIDTIPRLCKSKNDVILFFRGAGVQRVMLTDLEAQVKTDRDSITKFGIARSVLTRMNEAGDKALRPRRELLKRVVEFEDFSRCWENERLEAEGLVARVRSVTETKDAFTRMRQERDAEARRHREAQRREADALREHQEALAAIRDDFYHLFRLDDAHERGRLLESVLNRFFKAAGILVRESFRRTSDSGQGTIEQIDGVIELDGQIYLVEMKWLGEPVGKGDVAQHLVRVFGHSGSRGILISYSEYTAPAIEECKDFLRNGVVTLCTLQELVLLMERGSNLQEFLKAKIQGSIIDKQPYTKVL